MHAMTDKFSVEKEIYFQSGDAACVHMRFIDLFNTSSSMDTLITSF